MPDILVINPNSNELVTEKLRDTLSDLESVAAIECITMSDGPFGVESDADAAIAASLVVERIGNEQYRDACVIACYSDPGLRESRRRFEAPVFGMQESALKNAAENDRRFGVLALSDESIARHLPYIDSLELTDALAAELMHFYNCIINNDTNLDNISNAIKALEIAQKINEIIQSKKVVK